MRNRFWSAGSCAACCLALLMSGTTAVADVVTVSFSGYEVITAYEGTEGTTTATLGGLVNEGDPVWGSFTYNSDTAELLNLYININDVIEYSGPPAWSSNKQAYVENDRSGVWDTFNVVTTHSNPLPTLTLPTGVTDNLNYLQAGVSYIDETATLYSDTTVPNSVSMSDFTWSRVHLWTWFPDLNGDGVSQTAWRIFADLRPPPIPEPSTWTLIVLGGAGLLWIRRKRRAS